jgi:hypothetical protein
MKNIYNNVALAIVTVNELRHIDLFRNKELKETIECATHAYYGLIDTIIHEFGVTRQNLYVELIEIGYPHSEAISILDAYELWAMKMTQKKVTGEYT